MNHALIEAERLQKVIDELQERRKALKPEPVSPKLVERRDKTKAEWKKVSLEREKAGRRYEEALAAYRVEEGQKERACKLVDQDLGVQHDLQRFLLRTALSAANP